MTWPRRYSSLLISVKVGPHSMSALPTWIGCRWTSASWWIRIWCSTASRPRWQVRRRQAAVLAELPVVAELLVLAVTADSLRRRRTAPGVRPSREECVTTYAFPAPPPACQRQAKTDQLLASEN